MAKKFLLIDKTAWLAGFTEATIDALRTILSEEFENDRERTDDCIFGLYCAKSLVTSIEEVSDPKTMMRRYRKALKSIENLQAALDEFDVPEVVTLSDLIEGSEDDQILSRFDYSDLDPSLSGVYGITIYETRVKLNLLGRALKHALNRIQVSRGAKPKDAARNLAVFSAEALRERGVKLTSYDDGLFFRVLEVLFAECFDDVGTESHLRHGRFALQHELTELDEHDVKYLPAGSIET